MAKKAKNEKIQAWLKTVKKDYRKGLALYFEFDLEAKLKSKFVIGGDSPNNRVLLENELKRLVDVDPEKVEAERRAIAEKQKEADKKAKMNAAYEKALTDFSKSLINKDFEAACSIMSMLEQNNYKGEKDLHLEELKVLLADLEEEIVNSEEAVKAEEKKQEDLLKLQEDHDKFKEENTTLKVEKTALEAKIAELEAKPLLADNSQNKDAEAPAPESSEKSNENPKNKKS